MAHRPPSLTPVLDRRPDRHHGPLRLPPELLARAQLNKGKDRSTKSSSPRTSSTSRRRPTRTESPATGRTAPIRKRRDQRPPDDARRDPRPARRRRADVKNPQSGNFVTLLTCRSSGSRPDRSNAGWTATDAKVRGSHCSASSTPTWRRSTSRPGAEHPRLQASELVAPTGPATSNLPVVLLGDLNSDDDTVDGGDQQAYRSPAGSRHGRAQHRRPAQLLPRVEPAGRRRPGGSDRRLRPPGRPHHDPRPRRVKLKLRRSPAAAGQRLLELRPRRRLQRPALQPAEPSSRA